MKIDYTKDEISFTFPRYGDRYNPYDDQSYGEYPTFTGLIIRHRKDGDWDEIGFAGTIDMDYKSKEDQFSDIIVAWDGTEEDFIKKCKELEINVEILEV